mgnify:CR=1 FL=1
MNMKDPANLRIPLLLSGGIICGIRDAKNHCNSGLANLKMPLSLDSGSSQTRKKGQSSLLTHSILISFAIFLVLIVLSTMTTLRTDFEDFVSDKELQQSCILVSSAVEKIYVSTGYRSPSNFTAGVTLIRMPQKIANTAYRLVFENSSLTIDARPFFNTTCRIGFNLSYSGSSTGGLTQLKYVRYGNGTEALEMSNV